MNRAYQMLRRRHGCDCTGMNDRWCPVHGDCICPPDGDPDLESRTCPLHSLESLHACDRWFVAQVSPTLCAVVQYRTTPKNGDSNWYPMYWQGHGERGENVWGMQIPGAAGLFRRDEPGTLQLWPEEH